jgi:hypothetical protein
MLTATSNQAAIRCWLCCQRGYQLQAGALDQLLVWPQRHQTQLVGKSQCIVQLAGQQAIKQLQQQKKVTASAAVLQLVHSSCMHSGRRAFHTAGGLTLTRSPLIQDLQSSTQPT